MQCHAFLNREFISSLVWVVVGGVFCIGGVYYQLFDSGLPGPGLLPFIGGLALSSLGLIVLISSFGSAKRNSEVTKRFFPEKNSFRKIFFAIVGLTIYAIIFEYLGFILTTFFLLIFLLRFIEPQKWSVVWVTAILTTALFYLIFCIFLKVQLPKGLLGI